MKKILAALAISTAILISPVMAGEYVNHDNAVVRVDVVVKDRRGKTHDGHGTAWHIGGGRFITNAHVVMSQDVSFLKDGKPVPFKILVKDEDNDLAVLEAPELKDMPSLEISGNVPKIGDTVESMGYALGDELVHFWGRVGSREVALEDTDEKTGKTISHPIIKVGSTAIPGMSGGPVLDENGKVVGVTEIAWPASPILPVGAMNFFIPSHMVLDIIKKANEQPTPSETDVKL